VNGSFQRYGSSHEWQPAHARSRGGRLAHVRSCSARRGLATSLGLQAYPVRGVVSLIEGSMRPCSLATLRLSRSVSCSSTPRTSGVGTPWRSNSAGECRLPGERKAAAVPCSVGWRSKPPSDVNELRANPRRSSSTLGWTRPGTTRLYPRDSGPDKEAQPVGWLDAVHPDDPFLRW
jgi:hypothetical protein